jgi:hypothetical protein
MLVCFHICIIDCFLSVLIYVYMYVGWRYHPNFVTDTSIEIEQVCRLCQRCLGSHAPYSEHMSPSWSQILSPLFRDN